MTVPREERVFDHVTTRVALGIREARVVPSIVAGIIMALNLRGKPLQGKKNSDRSALEI